MKMHTLASAALILILLLGCQAGDAHKKAPRDLPAVEVETSTADLQQEHLLTEIVGTLQAVDQAVIAAKISGTIVEIPVVLGSKVQAGDILVKLSAEEISAQAIRAQAQLEQARRNLERERKLLSKNAATSESVKSLEDIFRIAEASYREAKTMLGYTTITAPFSGVVTAKMANVGDLATPGIPLLRLENRDKLQVVTSVPETLVLRINPGDMLTIKLPAADLTLQGTVAEIAPAADPQSRTATVKINIAEGAQLRSGQFARVVIPGKSKESLFVPASAVRTFGQMEQIFVVQDGKAYLRLVSTGAKENGQVEILAGLEPGEIVVTKSTAQLIDGQPVVAGK